MTTKQILFSVLVLGSVANNALSMNSPKEKTKEQRQAAVKEFMQTSIRNLLATQKLDTNELHKLSYRLQTMANTTPEAERSSEARHVWNNVSEQLIACQHNACWEQNISCDKLKEIDVKSWDTYDHFRIQSEQTPEARASDDIYYNKCLPRLKDIGSYQTNHGGFFSNNKIEQETNRLTKEIYGIIDSM